MVVVKDVNYQYFSNKMPFKLALANASWHVLLRSKY